MEVILQQLISQNYDLDFYSGTWMFGPNYFCTDRLCKLSTDLNTFTYFFKPETMEDIEFVVKTFYGYKKSFQQYM